MRVHGLQTVWGKHFRALSVDQRRDVPRNPPVVVTDVVGDRPDPVKRGHASSRGVILNKVCMTVHDLG